jgi:hypothetical protein
MIWKAKYEFFFHVESFAKIVIHKDNLWNLKSLRLN